MSAPYVAGQIDHVMRSPKYLSSVLIGFNPVSLAREIIIEKWCNQDKKTFKSVAEEMERCPQHIVLNPVVGPGSYTVKKQCNMIEPITGSTRMKGGTLTKILLETIFAIAVDQVFPLNEGNPLSVFDILHSFETTYRETYMSIEQLAKLVQLAGDTLHCGGHIHYISDVTSFSVFGLIDASECPPTFGADFMDVRGYIKGGWKTLQNREGDLSHIEPIFNIDLQHVRATPNDLVIVLTMESTTMSPELTLAMKNAKKDGSPPLSGYSHVCRSTHCRNFRWL